MEVAAVQTPLLEQQISTIRRSKLPSVKQDPLTLVSLVFLWRVTGRLLTGIRVPQKALAVIGLVAIVIVGAYALRIMISDDEDLND